MSVNTGWLVTAAGTNRLLLSAWLRTQQTSAGCHKWEARWPPWNSYKYSASWEGCLECFPVFEWHLTALLKTQYMEGCLRMLQHIPADVESVQSYGHPRETTIDLPPISRPMLHSRHGISSNDVLCFPMPVMAPLMLELYLLFSFTFFFNLKNIWHLVPAKCSEMDFVHETAVADDLTKPPEKGARRNTNKYKRSKNSL